MPRVAEHVVAERRRRLEELVGRERYLPVATLAERLGVSEATARRDLAVLEEQQRLTRTFGGAVASGPGPATVDDFNARFASYAERAGHMAGEKRRIAKAVAGLIKPGMTLFLDAGTTVGALAAYLTELPARKLKGVRVITHSLAVAERLAGVSAIETHVPGGRLLGRQMIVLGDATRRAMGAFDIDLACLGAEAVNAGGIFNSQADVVNLQRHVVLRAERTVILVDSSKLEAEAPERLLLPAEVDLLATDASASRIRAAGLDLSDKQLL